MQNLIEIGDGIVIRIRQPEDNSVDANEVGEGLHLIRNGITQVEQRHDENERRSMQKRSNIMRTKAAIMSLCDSRRKFFEQRKLKQLLTMVTILTLCIR